MTTLNMHPIQHFSGMPNFGGLVPAQNLQARPGYGPPPAVPNRSINAFAPSLVFDNSYFSQYYYNSGGNQPQNGFADDPYNRYFFDRPIFKIAFRRREGDSLIHEKLAALD